MSANISDSKLRNSELLKDRLKGIVNKIASGVSAEDFYSALTTLSKHRTSAHTLYKLQMADIINENDQVIEHMYESVGICGKYDEITRLTHSSCLDKTTKAWRPETGNCELQLRSFYIKALLAKKQKLEELVKEKHSLRMAMKNSLDKKRTGIRTQLDQILHTKEKLVRCCEI